MFRAIFGPQYPVFDLGLWRLRALVPVPKAAVHENRHPVARQHDIWLAGQILSMEAETEPCGVQRSPHLHLDASVLAAVRGHVPAACLAVESPISHAQSVARATHQTVAGGMVREVLG